MALIPIKKCLHDCSNFFLVVTFLKVHEEGAELSHTWTHNDLRLGHLRFIEGLCRLPPSPLFPFLPPIPPSLFYLYTGL
jgi:hypothetical protein